MIGTSTFVSGRSQAIQDILNNGLMEFMYTMDHDWDRPVRYIE